MQTMATAYEITERHAMSMSMTGVSICTADARGWCSECGVVLETCPVCQGIGYHKLACPDNSEDDQRREDDAIYSRYH